MTYDPQNAPLDREWRVLRRTIDVNGDYILLVEDQDGETFWVDGEES